MKKIYWKLVCTYDSFIESEQYFEHGRPKVIVKSNKPNCTICINNDGHKMKVQYMNCCKNECDNKCQTRYKLTQCLKKSKCVIYSLNEHEIAPIETQLKVKIRRGISHSTKEAIEINGVEEFVNGQTCASPSDPIFFGAEYGD
jgi:hypothetical protein